MGEYFPLQDFVCEWADYLDRRGHRVRRTSSGCSVLLSRNGKRQRYRWLLLCTHNGARRLTAIDHENIQRQLRLGHKAGQQVYVVVTFTGKVVVLPAAKAATMRILTADKGGMPWEP